MFPTSRVESFRPVMSLRVPCCKIDLTLQLPSTMSRFVPIPELSGRQPYLACGHFLAAMQRTQVQPAAWAVYELAVPMWMELPGGREIGRTAYFDGELRTATALVENVATRPLQVIIDRRGELLLTVATLTERP